MSLPDMTKAERAAYDMLCQAAENNEPCPPSMDIEDGLGFSSTSMGPKVIARLEAKGVIEVRRFQRFRQVKIMATGKWTKQSEEMRSSKPHVPRGTHDPKPLMTALKEIGLPPEIIERDSFQSLLSLEKKLLRIMELIHRRKVHFLTGDRGEV